MQTHSFVPQVPLGDAGTLICDGDMFQLQEINFRAAYYVPQTFLILIVKLEEKEKKQVSCLI